ncbi:hypothetical protein N3K66_001533 [Trichothecium roseum]|uniref:Uncharacterized protein n=1 Tax=Trichothecium roseum TaxID=47278 RepID=A0ACC0VF16_9HYPO|nr:hypothetical protein N3K66_001533 [Trichothecium roseum]
MAWSEKQPLLGRVVGPPQMRIPLCAVLAVAVMLAFSFIFLSYDDAVVVSSAAAGLAGGENKKHQQKQEVLDAPWSWYDIKPSTELRWESCYDNKFECARLDVPMDWQSPTEEQRVVLGVIKLPAKIKGSNLPPVFVNPGGPGGSGLEWLLEVGDDMQTIVGANQDLISFDPRGVGVSTPRVECWGSPQKRRVWSLQETPVVDERPGLIYDAHARAAAFSGACERRMAGTGILEHLSSAYAARDMLAVLEGTGHRALRYWGISYGSILGGVFAGLYPDRVERLVSDGNVDYNDWFHLDHGNFVADADLIFDAFDAACHRAGPAKCALWAETPAAVLDRRAAILEGLKLRPVLIPANATLPGGDDDGNEGPAMPELVTYSRLQRLTRGLAYRPLFYAERMAAAYAALERGDGLPFYELANSEDGPSAPGDMCSVGDGPEGLVPTSTEDAFSAITCSDSEPMDSGVEGYGEYVDKITGISRWTGAASSFFRVACAGRSVRPKWRVTGDDFGGDTAFPILFIGNLADNVTPLQSAWNNSAKFPSSRVLVQNSYGHATLSAALTCTAKHIRAYFQDGALPESGTECEPDYDLFEMPREDQGDQGEWEAEGAGAGEGEGESLARQADELAAAVRGAARKARLGGKRRY